MFKHKLQSVLWLCLSGSTLAWGADTDGDGVDDVNDVCCATPAGVLVNNQGRPAGDLDNDCDCDLVDFAIFQQSFTGPLNPSCCMSNADCASGEFCGKNPSDCDGEGTCAPTPTFCAPVVNLVCGCDGTTYQNSCFAALAGVSVAHAGECICAVNGDCGIGEFCDKATGDCNGSGTCADTPAVCPLLYDPVCGCNGQTYLNECHADQAGVNVDYDGECFTACSSNADCSPAELCKKATGDCNGSGVCDPRPLDCSAIFVPVCGCDDESYINECEASFAGVSIQHAGLCP